MYSWHSRSSSPVVTPGTTCGVMKSSVAAARTPALRMPSKAAAPWILIEPAAARRRASRPDRWPRPIVTSCCIALCSSSARRPQYRMSTRPAAIPLHAVRQRLCRQRLLPMKNRTPASEQRQCRASAASPPKTYTACVLIIGNEILSGRVQDENVAFLAKGLNEVGVRLQGGAGDPRRQRHDRRHGQRGAARLTTTSSPPAASARRMTTSPRNASPRRSR